MFENASNLKMLKEIENYFCYSQYAEISCFMIVSSKKML